ncbi:titin-like isoform X2 [Actinia tenebrosa]|uniref:Titin-like isoform X2 n=1 Tax=Actinia tenebrosa TaxID=6105 RepID=A0A6P8H9S4_ACTTE|nr:titin-like isoform X2 [Actinia tenebrosa]
MSINQDHERLWLAQRKKSASTEKNFLDPYALYGFFSDATSERNFSRRAKSATVRSTSHYNPSRHRNHGHPPGYKTPDFQIGNPTPTPATSRPASSRSGYSSARSEKIDLSSPTAFYLHSQRTRCKSAPPPKYVPRRPQTSKSSYRKGSAATSIRSAPQRAWELRTNSATNHRSLLSPKEVEKRHKERCKSAPLPYDFSRIELITEVPENGTDFDRLHAMTKPLACMPNIVKNAVTHNGLRHCCSAYDTRTTMTPETRNQFWPVPRRTVYHHRGFVPQYFSFVKPLHLSGEKPPVIICSQPTDNDQNDEFNDADLDDEILFEESFVYPETPSELSVSEKYDPSDDELNVMDNIVSEYLQSGIVSDPDDYDDSLSPLPDQSHTMSNQEQVPDTTIEDQGPEIEVIITKSEAVSPDLEEPQTVEEKEEKEVEIAGYLTSEEQQPETAIEEDEGQDIAEQTPDLEESISCEPERVPEEAPEPEEEPKICSPPVPIPEPPKVTFIDSITVTSYKPTEPKEKKTEPIKPILKPSKPPVPIMEDKPATPETPAKKPKPRPLVERREADLRPQVKAGIILKPEPPKVEEEKKEEKVEEPKPLEEKLPEPEFVHAPGAYRMYESMDLAQHELEKVKNKKSEANKTLTSTMPLPHAAASGHQLFPESNTVIHSVLEDERRKKEGMKPWLQGRLALSKQTSRFELPMDVRLLESMTAMEYLTKYCIISTRRKALYKHTFKKVDKDRDGTISFRELDKGLREIHVDSIDIKEVRNIIEMIGADDKTKFNMKQFSAIAAFSERILFSNFVTEETKNINSTKEIIEKADFCSLKSKLDGFNVNPTVRKILESL